MFRSFMVVVLATWFGAQAILAQEDQLPPKENVKQNKSESKALLELVQKLKKQVMKLEERNLDLQRKVMDIEKDAQAAEQSLNRQLQIAEERAKTAELNFKQAVAERERLKAEIKSVVATIANREQTIASLQNNAQKLRIEAIANENIAKTLMARNEHILAQIQELTRSLARLQGEKGNPGEPIRNPNAPNPPPAFVKGKITKVDHPKEGQVEINLGSDHGLNKGHTLEVYRLAPRPEYVGMIRVIAVQTQTSVGQFVSPPIKGKEIKIGDTAASTLSSN